MHINYDNEDIIYDNDMIIYDSEHVYFTNKIINMVAHGNILVT